MKKVLIIEDNDEVRENTAEILELSNYAVSTAENGKIGVEMALQEKPDLIICDIMMPVLDGYGVFHLLSKHKETASIPFIFLTAKSEKSDFRKGMEMGADDYITKPFDGIELLNAIEVRLKKTALLQQHFKDGIEGLNEFINHAKDTGKVQLTSDEREMRSYKKKFFVYREGERPKALYYVVSGKVKISRTNNDGKELITSILGAGDFFGYIPILEETNYKEDAQVLEDSQLMIIPKDDFQQLITSDLDIARQFIKIITHNILDKEEDLLNLAYNSVRQKVAYGLVQLYEKYQDPETPDPLLKMSRENMAQAIGIATESLIRTLGDFKDEKLIDIQTGKIQLINEKKLRSML